LASCMQFDVNGYIFRLKGIRETEPVTKKLKKIC